MSAGERMIVCTPEDLAARIRQAIFKDSRGPDRPRQFAESFTASLPVQSPVGWAWEFSDKNEAGQRFFVCVEPDWSRFTDKKHPWFPVFRAGGDETP